MSYKAGHGAPRLPAIVATHAGIQARLLVKRLEAPIKT